MSVYSVFSLVALLLKIGLAAKLIFYKQKIENSLLWLLVFLFAVNLLEYLALIDRIHSLVAFKLFYVFLIMMLASILLVIKTICGLKGRIPEILLAIGSIQAGILLTTDFIIYGFRPGGIGYTRIPGEYYYVFQTYALICLVMAVWYIGVMIKMMYNPREREINRAKSSVLIVSLSPLVIGLLTVLLLMAAGKNVNSAVLLPITTTLFLFGCFYATSGKKIIDWSMVFPLTPSRNAKMHLAYFCYTASDKTKLWDHLSGLEKAYIKVALEENGGKLTKTANALGCTPGKLEYRMKHIHKLKTGTSNQRK